MLLLHSDSLMVRVLFSHSSWLWLRDWLHPLTDIHCDAVEVIQGDEC